MRAPPWSSVVTLCAALVALTPRAGSERETAVELDVLAFPRVPRMEIGSGVLPEGWETSGAAWHPLRRVLLVVDDEGGLAALGPSGELHAFWMLPGSPDLEAVCVADPRTPFVYLGVEHPDAVLEFDLDAGEVVRSFDLSWFMTGPKSRGLEALAFLPDETSAEGGCFYAGLQDDGRIFVVELPLRSDRASQRSTWLTTLVPDADVSDLSGLCFDDARGTLYAVFDGPDLLRALDSSGRTQRTWALPGKDQEGVAVDGLRLYVVHDSGSEVWWYAPFPWP
jgi:uncharacterized protein YjiK